MFRFLIFSFPAIMDVILGAVFFIAAVRLSEHGATPFMVTLSMAVWAIVYSLCSVVVGRLVTPRNAAGIISFSGLFIALVSLGFITFNGVYFQYFWMFFIGIGMACFFCPFQVFMKAMEGSRKGGLVRSTSLYTFSWSMGLATGPFIVGLVWGELVKENGWIYCHLLNAVLACVVGLGIWPLKNYCESKLSLEPEESLVSSEIDYTKMPDLAWLGWVMATAGCISVSLVRTLFPYKSSLLEISRLDQGNVLALVSCVQAITALCLMRGKYWMYRVLPLVLMSISGLIGLLLFAYGSTVPLFYLGAVLYGIYAGSFFFCLVFYSLVHPVRSAGYLSINEALVGLTGILGPLAGGYLAGIAGVNIPFIGAGLLVLAALIIQSVTIVRKSFVFASEFEQS